LYFDTPPEGRELPEYVKRARANGSEERLSSIAQSYGMKFRSTERIYNTRLAHEATEHARENGKGNEFHKIVFRMVYAEGKDPSQWDVLRNAAKEAGLDDEAMQRDVESDKYTESVSHQVKWAYQIGVSGVPTYVINDRYALVGAQPYEVFQNALGQILRKKG
jgi:predicted DsbA family dithiol-disulfide isomerase